MVFNKRDETNWSKTQNLNFISGDDGYGAITKFGTYFYKRIEAFKWQVSWSFIKKPFDFYEIYLTNLPEVVEVLNAIDMTERQTKCIEDARVVFGDEAAEHLKSLKPIIKIAPNRYGVEECCRSGCGQKRKFACYDNKCCAILNPNGKMPSSKGKPQIDPKEYFLIPEREEY